VLHSIYVATAGRQLPLQGILDGPYKINGRITATVGVEALCSSTTRAETGFSGNDCGGSGSGLDVSAASSFEFEKVNL